MAHFVVRWECRIGILGECATSVTFTLFTFSCLLLISFLYHYLLFHAMRFFHAFFLLPRVALLFARWMAGSDWLVGFVGRYMTKTDDLTVPTTFHQGRT